MNAKTLRRVVISLPVIVTGCAAFDAHDPETILYAGSKMCIGDAAGCKALEPIIAELDSPKTTAAICAAGAMTEACKK